MNKDPPPENQLTGCLFVKVECTHNCGSKLQRQHMAAHQEKECPERPYSCEYCHEYHSTFKIVTEIHHPYCNQFPIPCPNKCREDPFQRQEIESHLRDECPLTPVSCPLRYAGCEVRLPRKEMPEHMKDTVTHLTLLATVTQTLLKGNSEHKKIIEELKEETQKLQQHNQQLEERQKATLILCQCIVTMCQASEQKVQNCDDTLRTFLGVLTQLQTVPQTQNTYRCY